MRKLLFLFPTIFFLVSFQPGHEVILDKKEAQKAFALLNDIRASPAKYYSEFNFLKNSGLKNTKLVWNDTLARVAEAKAYDMANRNYFGHTDPDGYGINYFINKSGYKLDESWLKNKSDNFFESISANPNSGEDVIRKFIIDQGVSSLGHRNHLLGVGEWNGSLVDIGIGFARRDSGSTYDTYVSLIIAKHNW